MIGGEKEVFLSTYESRDVFCGKVVVKAIKNRVSSSSSSPVARLGNARRTIERRIRPPCHFD